ncbi:MAG: hypothetical protein AAFQ01_02955 [Bacteroidota bacterium]
MSYLGLHKTSPALELIKRDLSESMRREVAPVLQRISEDQRYWESQNERYKAQLGNPAAPRTSALAQEQPAQSLEDQLAAEEMTPQEVYERFQTMGKDFWPWFEEKYKRVQDLEKAIGTQDKFSI